MLQDKSPERPLYACQALHGMQSTPPSATAHLLNDGFDNLASCLDLQDPLPVVRHELRTLSMSGTRVSKRKACQICKPFSGPSRGSTRSCQSMSVQAILPTIPLPARQVRLPLRCRQHCAAYKPAAVGLLGLFAMLICVVRIAVSKARHQASQRRWEPHACGQRKSSAACHKCCARLAVNSSCIMWQLQSVSGAMCEDRTLHAP